MNSIRTTLVSLLFFCGLQSTAQRKEISGNIIDDLTKEPISFASVFLKNAGNGKITDSAGYFKVYADYNKADTLMISYVGYQTLLLPLDSMKFERPMDIFLERNEKSDEVVVKIKINKGLFLWRKIMSKKKEFNRYDQTNFGYEAYNKIEIDIKNIAQQFFKKNFLFKPYSFVFDNVDSTSEDKPFLPAYLIESVSDYAYQKKSKKFYENIKAIKTKGFDNQSFNKLLGVMNQNVNIFGNYINVMSRDFIGPFNDNADLFYNFSVVDTQMIDNKRIFRFVFKPKRPGLNAFQGDAWVQAGTFEVHKISMYLGKDANINYISRIGIFQEFTKLNDSTLFLSRDKLFADFNTLDKHSLAFIGRKTTSYKNIIINSDSISNFFKNQKTEEIVKTAGSSNNLSDSIWQALRHDSLSINEKQIYTTIDHLLEMPKFQSLQKNLRFIGTGYRNIGNAEIGPWFNWISSNSWEGYRFRFDLGTNTGFNKNIYLHGYLAYGTKDQNIKGKAEAFWILKREPNRFRLHASFSNDIDNGISEIGQVSQDNIFSLAISKPNITRKFIRLQDSRFEIYKDLGNGLSSELFLVHRKFNPLQSLPAKGNFITDKGEALTSFEVSLKLRFAYLEEFLNGDFFRYSLGSKYPIAELTLTKGFPGIFKSAYNYSKISLSVKDDIKINPIGSLSLKVYGGYIDGTLPFVFLENHMGNDIYYYNSSSLNLMKRFEYLSDKYAGINLEHRFGSGIFQFLPITRKLKWRQFWNIKTIWGSLRNENIALNGGTTYFKSLRNKNYIEMGTGIDNIFKVFRIDFVWRVSPDLLKQPSTGKFGIFGSFQLQF